MAVDHAFGDADSWAVWDDCEAWEMLLERLRVG
jgi:hypothetical protein